jgi:hypothetical protein
MNALKCDRCKNYFDYNPAIKNFIAFGHKDIVIGKNFPVKDICPDCIESFMNWFENPDNYDPHDLVKNINEEFQKTSESPKTVKEYCEQREADGDPVTVNELKRKFDIQLPK